MIPRLLAMQIQTHMHRKRAIVVLGPRQVGKTTLMESRFSHSSPEVRWYNAEEPGTNDLFKDPSA
jgi:predicted AAA+ superfamily ATPase